MRHEPVCVCFCLCKEKLEIFLYDKRFLGLDRVNDDSTPLSSNSLEQLLPWNISERHGEVVKTFLWLLVCIRTYAQSFSSSDESEACWGDEGNIDFSLSGLGLIRRFSHFRILRVSRWMGHIEVERVYDLIRMDLSRNMRDSSWPECNWDYWKDKNEAKETYATSRRKSELSKRSGGGFHDTS